MPCKIQIKENITRSVEQKTDAAFNKSLLEAQRIASDVNSEYGYSVVKFTQSQPDYIDRKINIPSELVDKYYFHELLLEEQEARSVQQKDAERTGEEYSDEYLFLQKEGVIKPGVEEVFNENAELASIGTSEQYSQYLDTIFPDSQIKDIVYHGTGESKKIENFNTRDGRIYFSDNLTASQYANWDEFNRAQDDPFSNPKAQVVPAIINLENPVTLDDVEFKETETNKEGDGIIGLNIKDPLGGIETQYVVRDANQVHVLGSKKDIEDFKNFIRQNKSTSIEKASTASKETIEKIKEIAKNANINFQTLEEYLKGNPEVDAKGVNGLADTFAKIVAIAEGKEDVAITEEVIHVLTAIAEITNPKLITEMISKIGRFKIYNQVLEKYGKLKQYQLPNGKPDIRKIKREAVDKLLAEVVIKKLQGSVEFPELMEEENRTMIQRFWDALMDLIRGFYRSSNINIFEISGDKIIQGNYAGATSEVINGQVYFQLSSPQKEFQERVAASRENLEKVEGDKKNVDPLLADTEEASNFYRMKLPDGTFEKVLKRVTDRVHRWYETKFGKDKTFTEAEKKFNNLKRDHGIKYHYFFEEIHSRYFHPDGTKRDRVSPRTLKVDGVEQEVYNVLENYFVELIKSYSKNGKTPLVFSEVMVYDPKEKEAGTLDLVIVDEDGKASIFDWKFMTIAESSNDVPWYKQGAFNIQLTRYKEILRDAYGIKEFEKVRAIPILMDFKPKLKYVKGSDLEISGIHIGSVDTSKITDLKLVPVSQEEELTGVAQLDKLISKLNSIYSQVSKKEATTDEEREFKRERLNMLKQAIRMAQGTKDVSGIVDVIKLMRLEADQLLNDWKTIYSVKPAAAKDFENAELSDYAENLREFLVISDIFANVDKAIGSLIYNDDMVEAAKTKQQIEELKYRKEVLDDIQTEATRINDAKEEIKDVAKKFADKFMGERNLVKGLLNPQAVWKNLASWFRGVSESPLASIQIL
jgi:hypothetical protein